MVMSYRQVTTTTTTTGVTTVDCQKQVRSWRLLRSFMELLIPTCNCFIVEENHDQFEDENYIFHQKPFISSSIITGTIYGNRRGKVNLCIQTNPNSTNPILLLEMAVPTSVLAREMKGGFLRIVLECNTTMAKNGFDSNSLLSMPQWSMYCNGRKVGFAVKRKPNKTDIEVFRRMESVVVGAGVINSGKETSQNDDIMYLRGNFERLRGSYNSESFHLIDPDGNIGQELSIFFLRSR